MKNQMKTFWFIKFHTKLWLAQSPCVLGSINRWVYLGPDFICYRIRYLKGVKSGNTCFFSLLPKNQSSFLWFFAYRKSNDIA